MSDPSLSQLKSRAQLLKPSIRLGKAGLTPEFLAEFAAIDLACLHLMEQVERGFPGRRPRHFGYMRIALLLLIFEQELEDRRVQRIGG